MVGVNKVILLGNLGHDPEVSYTPSGMAICKFSLATSKKKKDGTDVTQWHRCTAFDKRGETIAKYVSKGQQLYVEGELQYGQYEKDGITRYTTDIILSQFSFVGSKGGNKEISAMGYDNQTNGGVNDQNGNDDFYKGGTQSSGLQGNTDDDIPF